MNYIVHPNNRGHVFQIIFTAFSGATKGFIQLSPLNEYVFTHYINNKYIILIIHFCGHF